MHRTQLELLPALLLALTGIPWLLSLHRRRRTPEQVIRRMHTGQLDGLNALLLEPSTSITALEFQRSTGGLRGLLRRYQNARGWVAICEHARENGTADTEDLNRMRLNARRVALASILHVAETYLSKLSPHIMAAQGISALQAYWIMSQDIYPIAAAEGFTVGKATLKPYL